MSVRVISWVWEQSLAEGTDRLVLLAIADCAADDGGNAWPSISTLAGKARVSARTVQRSVKALQLLGEIEIDANAGRHGTNMYRIRMDRQIVTLTDSHPVNLSPVTESPRQSVTPSTGRGGVTTVTPEGDTPVTRTVLEPSLPVLSSFSSAAADRDDVERICTRLADRIEANGSKRPNVTKAWRDAARLLIDKDGRSEQQILTAIEWCQTDTFWRSNVMSMPKLRDKYDQMRLAAQRPGTAVATRQTGTSTDHIARAAARLGVAR